MLIFPTPHPPHNKRKVLSLMFYFNENILKYLTWFTSIVQSNINILFIEIYIFCCAEFKRKKIMPTTKIPFGRILYKIYYNII